MHPVLLELQAPWGPVLVQSYGTTLGLSLVLGWFVVQHLGARDGLCRRALSRAFVGAVVAGLLGARALSVLTAPSVHPFAVADGGMVAYGGFLGGLAGAWLVTRSSGLSLPALADVAAPALALGLGLTRVGCYLHGCDFGRPLGDDAPGWLRAAGTFPHWPGHDGAPAFIHHVLAYDLSPLAAESLPIHPTQLYASGAGLALFAFAWWRRGRRRFIGQVALELAMAYAAFRFGVEVLRDDPERGFLLGLSTSQWISLALLPPAALASVRGWASPDASVAEQSAGR